MPKPVILRFVGDASNLNATFAKVNAEGSKLGNGLKKGLGLAGLSMASAGVAAGAFAKASIGAFQEAEKAQSRLADAFHRFPALADTNIVALRKLNSTLAQKTRFDDDATASGQAVLAQFKLTGQQIVRLTPLLQDYASKTGKDLPTAARDLGKALNGQGRALKAIGIDFKSTGDATDDLQRLTGLLQEKVGGFAEREGKTAAGRAEILRNKMGELQEKIGEKLLPIIERLVTVLGKVVDWFDKLSPEAQRAIGIVAALTAGIWLLNVAMSANPVTLVVAGIVALTAALIVAYDKSEGFRNAVNTLLTGMLSFFSTVINGAALAFGWIPGIGPKLKEAAKKFEEFKNEVNASINGIKNEKVITVKVTGTGYHAGHDYIGPIAGDSRVSTGDAKKAGHRAAGGPTSAYGAYVVGEHGPELLTMGSRGGYVHSNASFAGGRSIVINMPPGSDGEDVVNVIRRYERSNGSSWRNN